MPQTEFYRPVKGSNSAPGCPRSDERAALEGIHLLATAGVPVSLCEARQRLSAINLIALEGLGNETVFEMVCRIMAEDGVTA